MMKKLLPGETLVKEGTYLWACTVECEICIVHSPVRYGSGDDDDPPVASDDTARDSYYVRYGSTTQRWEFNAGGAACDSIEAAIASAEAAPGIGATIRWKPPGTPGRVFHVDSLSPDGLVIGRNDNVDIPLGSVFAELRKSRFDGETDALVRVDLGLVAVVALRLEEVHWYRRTIDHIPSGHTAALRLGGEGVGALEHALAGLAPREMLHLCC